MAHTHHPRFASPLHSLKHAALVRLRPTLTAATQARAATRRECQANEYASLLRSLGHPCPAGSRLFGVEVTR